MKSLKRLTNNKPVIQGGFGILANLFQVFVWFDDEMIMKRYLGRILTLYSLKLFIFNHKKNLAACLVMIFLRNADSFTKSAKIREPAFSEATLITGIKVALDARARSPGLPWSSPLQNHQIVV